MLKPPQHRPPPDPYRVPHRKNAAEWLMWFALLPLVPFAVLLERVRANGGHGNG